jgi:hypothetical protein
MFKLPWIAHVQFITTTKRYGRVLPRFFNTSPSLFENEDEPSTKNVSALERLRLMNIKIPKGNKMPSRPSISELDIMEKFIKGGSGKGGQKINKTNSKVQLTHIPTGLVVTSQATRSRDQNRKIAREILALKIEEMEKGAVSRQQLVIARKQMLKQRAKKKTKAKYKKLAAATDEDNVEPVIILEEEDDALPKV